MFHSVEVSASAPHAVRRFVALVVDVNLRDVHAMLRLPRPEVQIDEGCNFAIMTVLMNVISGVSVTLYEPPPNARRSGKKFKSTLKDFYAWDTEPTGALSDPGEGARLIYEVFRNPMAHAFGLQDPEPTGPVTITRFQGAGLSADDLNRIERSQQRPSIALRNAPTLRRNHATQALELSVEAFYWGVRELLRRLTADTERMAAAEALLRPMMKKAATPRLRTQERGMKVLRVPRVSAPRRPKVD